MKVARSERDGILSDVSTTMKRAAAVLVLVITVLLMRVDAASAGDEHITTPKKIVLIAGTKSHGPGHHEYEKGMRLIKACLDASAGANEIRTEVHLDGWPEDPKTLDDADTIVMFSDGSDHDEKAHPLLHGDRLAVMEKQMKRGCGFVAIHYTVFVPIHKGGRQFLDWLGGHFDYETGPGPRKWFSQIRTAKTKPKPASPEHPICRGMRPFELREEYYYNIRFRPGDGRLTPILTTPIPGEPAEQVVAWAVERDDGGRGFGFTGGHFHDNWKVENFRRMVLNAVLWTAKATVPKEGVHSKLPSEQELSRVPIGKPLRTAIITGHQYPGHKWQQTTPVIREALLRDARFDIRIVEDVEFLATTALHDFDVLVMNYCNWKRPGISNAAKDNFAKYLEQGGGLVIIHFANGAFHFSLPEAGDSDWTLWRTKICRRVWDHTEGKSGHDAYGKFLVEIANEKHPITKGMEPFQTTDELYFRQQGVEPIEVLATARSKVTGQNEPMAFVYNYVKGRVFQTVLGHDAASLRVPGVAELVRRGTVWAASREQRTVDAPKAAAQQPAKKNKPPSEPLVAGRFGKALNATVSSARAEHRPIYAEPPLTVECWAKIRSKNQFNILVAQSPKASAEHWELYTYAGSGEFSVFLPGYVPAEIKSGVDITDDRWHYLAMAFDGARVSLFIDGKSVKQQQVNRTRTGGPNGPLLFGAYQMGSQHIGCDGSVDEVRISNAVRKIEETPIEPFVADAQTVGLWHFDATEVKRLRDSSSTGNSAVLKRAGGAAEDLDVEYHVVDPELKIVKLDYSADESFLSIRADTAGRLFVGCREALFVYEPDDTGGYEARKLLYRFPPDTWVNDIEIRGNDVYCMTPAALYLLPGARLERENIRPKRLIWGTPVDLHVTYHGLAWGPDGDLRFTSGDPLLTFGDFKNRPDHWGHWNVYTQPEGTAVPFTGTGGFYRCRPDGSGFQVIAQGTRGSCGLAFDERWNLFSNDNDHESIPSSYVPGRLLHVTPNANFFWPRGWMASKTPQRADLLETMFTGMGRAVPVGQTYYNESYLPEKYRHNLLVARWGQRRIDRYPISPRGASFKAEEFPFLVGSGAARPVGVAVGRGGRVFAAISHLPANAHSPKYASDLIMITRKDDSPPHRFDPYDAPTVKPDRLWNELSCDSWWRRQRAHVEIARRGGVLLDEAVERLEQCVAPDPAINHLPWLAGMSGQPRAAELLSELTHHSDSDARLQTLGALADFSQLKASRDIFVEALADASTQIQRAAIHGIDRTPGPVPAAVLKGPARSTDTYLRQGAAFFVAERGTLQQIRTLCTSDDAAGRLAGILSAGFRLTVPATDSEPPQDLTLSVRRTGGIWDAKAVVKYANETVDLDKLGRLGSFTTAGWWQHAKQDAEPRALYDLLVARLSDADDRNRLQAAYFLSLLNDAGSNPLVEKVYHDDLAGHLAAAPLKPITQAWLVGPFSPDDRSKEITNAIEAGPIELSAEYASARRQLKWVTRSTKRAFELPQNADSQPGSFSYLYIRLQSLQPAPAELVTSKFDRVAVWHNGSLVSSENNAHFDLQPGSNDILVRVEAADSFSPVTLQFRSTASVEATLPEDLGLGSLAERLKQNAADPNRQQNLDEFLAIDWKNDFGKGDPVRGAKLFGADGLSCIKCHGILPGQDGNGAPSLMNTSKRFTVSHLVESILLPSKQIAPVFRATLIVTVEGKSLTGLVVEEDDNALVLLLPNGTRQMIDQDDVEERKLQQMSPMPNGLVKTPDELRDILTYLYSVNGKVTTGAN